MQIGKHDGDSWNADGTTLIAEGESIDVIYSPAASGDMMEISVDGNDVYVLTFFGWKDDRIQEQPLGGPAVVPEKSGEGLSVRYLPLPDFCIGQKIAKVNIRPVQGDGRYSVGHLWIYSDTFTKKP